jgi:hypothetical protein
MTRQQDGGEASNSSNSSNSSNATAAVPTGFCVQYSASIEGQVT